MSGKAIISVTEPEDAQHTTLDDTEKFEEAFAEGMDEALEADVSDYEAEFIEEAEEPFLLIHVDLDPQGDANYARKVNAESMEIELKHYLLRGLDSPTGWYDVSADVQRATLCDHPDDSKTVEHDDDAPVEGGVTWVRCNDCDTALPEDAAPAEADA